jgi:hypothetical protein
MSIEEKFHRFRRENPWITEEQLAGLTDTFLYCLSEALRQYIDPDRMRVRVTGPIGRWAEIAEALRQYRDQRGLDRDKVTDHFNWYRGKLVRIELGTKPIPIDDLAKLLQFYRVPRAEKQRLMRLAREAFRQPLSR